MTANPVRSSASIARGMNCCVYACIDSPGRLDDKCRQWTTTTTDLRHAVIGDRRPERCSSRSRTRAICWCIYNRQRRGHERKRATQRMPSSFDPNSRLIKKINNTPERETLEQVQNYFKSLIRRMGQKTTCVAPPSPRLKQTGSRREFCPPFNLGPF